MRVIHKEYTVDGYNGEWILDIYGDTHLGSKSVDEKLLAKHIAETKESGHYWCHVGDVVDGILPPDRRFDKRNLAEWAWDAFKDDGLIQAEWDAFQRYFNPIRDKGLFVLDGDGKHNQTRDVSDCFGSTLSCMEIEGGFPACHLLISFKRGSSTEKRSVELFFHHGWFSGRTRSYKVRQLEVALSVYPNVWFLGVGHGHDKVPARVDTLIVEGKKQKQLIRRAAMTGSYLQTYAMNTTGYGEVKGYNPVALGRITMIARPFCTEPDKRIELINM